MLDRTLWFVSGPQTSKLVDCLFRAPEGLEFRDAIAVN